jgi:O-methyltransferase involved in polyketide biosynthesis
MNRLVPDLSTLPETMLLALNDRAVEAKRPDGVLTDPTSVRIYEAIDYDFTFRFGGSEGSLAVRAAEIDRVLRQWLADHPNGFVVSLGEGLETQVRRVDNGRMRWLSVDLPEAIRLRECFISPTDRFRHLAASALDRAWMEAVEASFGVFIVAQGLFMYLEPEAVRRLLVDIAERFPGAQIVFDVVPRWFSRLTLLGLWRTRNYRFPPMPWGINCDEIEQTLRQWSPVLGNVRLLRYCMPRGVFHDLDSILRLNPLFRNAVPNLVHVTTAKT